MIAIPVNRCDPENLWSNFVDKSPSGLKSRDAPVTVSDWGTDEQLDCYPLTTGWPLRLALPYFKIHQFFLPVQSRWTLRSQITIQNNFTRKTLIFSLFKIRTYKYSPLKDTTGKNAPLPLITAGLQNSDYWSASPTGWPVGLDWTGA